MVDAVHPVLSHRFEDVHPLADVAAGDLDPPGQVRRTARQFGPALEEDHLFSVGQKLPRQVDPELAPCRR